MAPHRERVRVDARDDVPLAASRAAAPGDAELRVVARPDGQD